jgi:hypothetical protein
MASISLSDQRFFPDFAADLPFFAGAAFLLAAGAAFAATGLPFGTALCDLAAGATGFDFECFAPEEPFAGFIAVFFEAAEASAGFAVFPCLPVAGVAAAFLPAETAPLAGVAGAASALDGEFAARGETAGDLGTGNECLAAGD